MTKREEENKQTLVGSVRMGASRGRRECRLFWLGK